MTRAVLVGAALLGTMSAACGTSSDGATELPRDGGSHDGRAVDAATDGLDGTTDATGDDGRGRIDAPSSDAALDARALKNFGETSTTYPAFMPDVPQIEDQGGSVLHTPHIVTVTWPGDPNASAFETFGDDLGASAYWQAVTSEYGVGPAWSNPESHVRLTEEPVASWTDTALATWLADHLASYATYGLPAPDTETLYVLYLASGTDINVIGSYACFGGIRGYHDSLPGSGYPYAVVVQCTGDTAGDATQYASHEIVEASTDPNPNGVPAYTGIDGEHVAWAVFQDFADEVADMCENYFSSVVEVPLPNVREPDAGADGGDGGSSDTGLPAADAGSPLFQVQRSWSNASAAAGHDPCVPVGGGPYASVTPLNQQLISLDLSWFGGSSNVQTLGYRVLVGQTMSIPLGFHTDVPTATPWTITPVEGNPLPGGSTSSHLTMSVDEPTGENGHIAYLTVTVNSVDTSMQGELVTIVMELPGWPRTFLPLLISNE